jgi:hypothetical protein
MQVAVNKGAEIPGYSWTIYLSGSGEGKSLSRGLIIYCVKKRECSGIYNSTFYALPNVFPGSNGVIAELSRNTN